MSMANDAHIVQFHKATTTSFLLSLCDHETGEVSSHLLYENDVTRLFIYLKAALANPEAYAPLFPDE